MGILEKKKAVNRLVDESVNDDNSVVDTTEKLHNLKLGDTSLKVNDTIKLDLESMKSFDLFDVGNVVFVIGGKSGGRAGIIKKREKDKGSSFEIIRVQDSTGRQFATRKSNVFPVVQDGKPWVPSKPWETILEEAKQKRQKKEEAKQRRQKKEIGQATA